MGWARLGADVDYIVINVSSPNTPGLRKLQQKEALGFLVKNCIQARSAIIKGRFLENSELAEKAPWIPLLIKV